MTNAKPDAPKTHGGSRRNAGRKLEVQGVVAEKRTVTLDEITVRRLKVLGDGNVSMGIRKAAEVAYARYQATP